MWKIWRHWPKIYWLQWYWGNLSWRLYSSGGEIASFILIDACVRLIPEVLGNSESLRSESFHDYLLEYSQYTKPSIWKKLKVPEVLLTGNHKKISDWRLKNSLEKTKKIRPELYNLFVKEKKRKLWTTF